MRRDARSRGKGVQGRAGRRWRHRGSSPFVGGSRGSAADTGPMVGIAPVRHPLASRSALSKRPTTWRSGQPGHHPRAQGDRPHRPHRRIRARARRSGSAPHPSDGGSSRPAPGPRARAASRRPPPLARPRGSLVVPAFLVNARGESTTRRTGTICPVEGGRGRESGAIAGHKARQCAPGAPLTRELGRIPGARAGRGVPRAA